MTCFQNQFPDDFRWPDDPFILSSWISQKMFDRFQVPPASIQQLGGSWWHFARHFFFNGLGDADDSTQYPDTSHYLLSQFLPKIIIGFTERIPKGLLKIREKASWAPQIRLFRAQIDGQVLHWCLQVRLLSACRRRYWHGTCGDVGLAWIGSDVAVNLVPSMDAGNILRLVGGDWNMLFSH